MPIINTDLKNALDKRINYYKAEVIPEPGSFREIFDVDESFNGDSWKSSGMSFGDGMLETGRGVESRETKGHERAVATITTGRFANTMAWERSKLQATGVNEGEVKKYVEFISASAEQKKDKSCAAVINSTANIYDGNALFGTHPQDSNNTSGTDYTNTSTSGTSFTETNIQAALTVLEDDNAFNEDGSPIEIKADVMLVTTTAQEMAAKAVLMATGKAGTAYNDANTLPDLKVVKWRNLYDSTSAATRAYWYLVASKGVNGNGFKFIAESGGLSTESELKPGSDTIVSYANAYWGAGVNEWRHIVRHINA